MIHYISIPRIAPEFSRTGACAGINVNSKGTACKHTRMQSLWPELTRRSRSPGDGRARDGEGLRSNCKEQC
jgi:hypothetical protein